MPDTATTDLPPIGAIFNDPGDDAPAVDPPVDSTPPAEQTSDAAPVNPPADSTPPAGSAEPAQPTRLDQIRDLGFENVESEDDAVARLMADYQLRTQRDSERDSQIRAMQEQNTALLEYMRSDGRATAPPQATPAEGQSAPWFKVDAPNPQLQKIWKTENGEWKQGTPQEIMIEDAKYQASMGEFAETLLADPERALRPGIEAVVQEILQKSFGVAPDELASRLDLDGSRTTASQTEQIVQEITPFIHHVDPRTGSPDINRPNDLGYEFISEAEGFAALLGVTRDEALADDRVIQATYRAMRHRFAAPDDNPPPAAPDVDPPAPTNGDRRSQNQRNHIDKRRRRATGESGGGGNNSPPALDERAMAPDLAVGQDMAAALRESGFFTGS